MPVTDGDQATQETAGHLLGNVIRNHLCELSGTGQRRHEQDGPFDD